MRATPIAALKEVRADGSVVEMVVWQVPEPVPPCAHYYKYRLYFGIQGVCRVRYDNERGKGDHKHIDGIEFEYSFQTIEQLFADFKSDVESRS